MEPVKNFELCFFVSRDHPLANAREISAKRLARYPLVIGRAKKVSSRVDDVLGSIRANGVALNVFMRCEWPDAVKNLIQQGEAVGVLYQENVEEAVSAGQFKIVNVIGVNLTVVSYVLYSRDRALSQNGKAFLHFLHDTKKNATPQSIFREAQHYLLLVLAAACGLVDLALAM
jgi:DNA-binding transcriptional LysR family regulator